MNSLDPTEACLVDKIFIASGQVEGDSVSAVRDLEEHINRVSRYDPERGLLTTACARCMVMFTMGKDRFLSPTYPIDCVDEASRNGTVTRTLTFEAIDSATGKATIKTIVAEPLPDDVKVTAFGT